MSARNGHHKTYYHISFSGNLPLVESKLWAFEDVAVSLTALAWTSGDLGHESAFVDFLLNGLVELSVVLLLSIVEVFLLESGLEWSSIDVNDAGLHEGVGTDELVVGRVIAN